MGVEGVGRVSLQCLKNVMKVSRDTVKVVWSRDRSSKERPSQIKSGQVKSSQARSTQVL